MREAEIEDRFRRYAITKGVIAYKFNSPNRRNVPDRLVLGPNKLMFFIEFKAPGEQPTLAQFREHTRLQAMGFPVYVIDRPGEAEILLDMRLAELSEGAD